MRQARPRHCSDNQHSIVSQMIYRNLSKCQAPVLVPGQTQKSNIKSQLREGPELKVQMYPPVLDPLAGISTKLGTHVGCGMWELNLMSFVPFLSLMFHVFPISHVKEEMLLMNLYLAFNECKKPAHFTSNSEIMM